MKNISHSAAFSHSEKYAPLNAGTEYQAFPLICVFPRHRDFVLGVRAGSFAAEPASLWNRAAFEMCFSSFYFGCADNAI